MTVNGDSVQATAPDCQQSTMKNQDLKSEQSDALSNSRQLFHSYKSGQQGSDHRIALARYSKNGSLQTSGNMPISQISSNGFSMVKYDEENMSSGNNNKSMNGDWERFFTLGDVAAFVFDNGTIEMKPSSCLSQKEKESTQNLQLEWQNRNQNLQREMDDWRNNFFGRSWPFHDMQQVLEPAFLDDMPQQIPSFGPFLQRGYNDAHNGASWFDRFYR